jgi:hypothetical protein
LVVLLGTKINEQTQIDVKWRQVCEIVNQGAVGLDLSGADLRGADLSRVNFSGANLTSAKLSGANLRRATLTDTNLSGADLTDCSIYGISAWKLNLEETTQADLVISDEGEPIITVDNIEVAQFVYLLLHNEKIRDVIGTIGNKGVLILGRFTPERKAILDAIREELRQRNYVPIMFDFARPKASDFTETIMTLAGMCRFVIADITNPRSSPLELQATVPNYMVPFVPIIQEGEQPFAMFKDLHVKYDKWMLTPFKYRDLSELIDLLEDAVITPALEKHRYLEKEKSKELVFRTADDY